MTPTTSAQIASFIGDIRAHLQKEIDSLLTENKRSQGSFSEGFAEGLRFWQRVHCAEDDFRYALLVLEKLLEPLEIEAPHYETPLWSGQPPEEVAELLGQEIARRDQELGVLQKRVLDVPAWQAESLYNKETRSEFETSFQEGLRDLLR